MEIVFGLAGVLLGICLFVLGFFMGRKTAAPVRVEPAPEVLSKAERDRIEKERRELEEDQRAFRQLVGYSADIAYGLAQLPSEDGKAE